MLNEAMFAVHEGVATPDAVDTIMKLGRTTRWGRWRSPTSSAWTPAFRSSASSTRSGDDKYRPCPLLVQMVDAGWLGRKSAAASTATRGGGEKLT